MKNETILVCAVLAMLAAPLARAATLTVTSTADNGPGSLRAALASAAAADTIDASGVSGTILLTSGELRVVKGLTILGPGPANLAVNGNFPNTTNRVFHIGSNTVVTISGLTITNGRLDTFRVFPVGGGIYNDQARLTVSNCTLSGNSANYYGGGIYNYAYFGGTASVHIVNSTLSGNSAGGGGGIYNDSEGGSSTSLTIVSSTLTGNSAWDGGGIFDVCGENCRANLEIVNSTLSGNSAIAGLGGGIIKGSFGGSSAKLEIVNSTLSGNSASNGLGGGIFTQVDLASLSVAVVNSTLSGNSADLGGGIYNSIYGGPATASVAIVNSTLSGNRANGGGGIFNDDGFGGTASLEIGSSILDAGALGGNLTNLSGTVTSLGYNLSSDDGGGFLMATGDQTNTDPMLGPLQDNGGPTSTHALACGSPAIDTGINFTTATTDQRGVGFFRIFDDPTVLNATGGDGADIGAFEVQPGVCAPRDSDGDGVVDTVDHCPGSPPGAMVNSTGCNLSQLVPCAGPLSGGTWKNHGQYVQAVVRAATDFLNAGLITPGQRTQIVTEAAHSKCGSNEGAR